MNNDKKIIMAIFIVSAIFLILGSTFAYWNWSSSSAQNTAVTFTVASGFSCSADGGGSITSNDKQLAPAACTNTTYAIKRTITVSPTITQPNKTIYLDLWLKVNNIGSGLSNSGNMRYALTTSPSDCITEVIASGNFKGATNNTQKELLHYKEYSSTITETYYLWIWLDSIETNTDTMNQTFNIELGGNCTDSNPFVYTGAIYDSNVPGNNVMYIGQSIPSTITKFYDPDGPSKAMDAIKTAVGGGDILNYPFFVRHVIVNDIITESYVGFVITADMAGANNTVTAGTYYLRGLDTYDNNWNCKSQYLDANTGDCISPYFQANESTLLKAFGSTNCSYYSSYDYIFFTCQLPGILAEVTLDGHAFVRINESNHCTISSDGRIWCSADGDSYCYGC